MVARLHRNVHHHPVVEMQIVHRSLRRQPRIGKGHNVVFARLPAGGPAVAGNARLCVAEAVPVGKETITLWLEIVRQCVAVN